MKRFLLIMMVSTLGLTQTVYARTIEVEVHGMTCSFCVDSLERKFGKMSAISKVDVSLKQKIVRLETQENSPSIETIRKAVLDAGFTPVKITVKPDEK
ncbi:MAG: cation transporter [Gallionella sp.]